MKILVSLVAVLGFSSAAFAGPMLADYSKNPISNTPLEPVGCPCFDGKFEIGAYVAGIFPEGADVPDAAITDSVGAGISMAYFFNRNIGLDFGAAWYDAESGPYYHHDSSVVHNYSLDLVYRFAGPVKCFAPYVFGGAGVHTNSQNVGLYRLGGGVDIRFQAWNCLGLFADSTYTWTGDGVQDYAIGRLGVRIPF